MLTASVMIAMTATSWARSAPLEKRVAGAMQRPHATRAVGFYDPTLRRVVLVGGADQPQFDKRDRVWSWSGTRWEPVTDSGPPARANAGAAFDARRRVAVVTGGARRKANDSAFETIASAPLCSGPNETA